MAEIGQAASYVSQSPTSVLGVIVRDISPSVYFWPHTCNLL